MWHVKMFALEGVCLCKPAQKGLELSSIFTISILLVSDVPGRSFWDGEETHSSILAQASVTVHKPPTGLSAGDSREEKRGALEEGPYRTNSQESASAPT